MTYFKCKWNHSFPDEPIMLYSELDDQRWELRKVEVFRDGRMGFADSEREFGGSGLGLAPWPPLAKIAADPQYEPEEITGLEFESVWSEAIAHASEGNGVTGVTSPFHSLTRKKGGRKAQSCAIA